MATGKALGGDWSMTTGGWKGCFSCCFASSNDKKDKDAKYYDINSGDEVDDGFIETTSIASETSHINKDNVKRYKSDQTNDLPNGSKWSLQSGKSNKSGRKSDSAIGADIDTADKKGSSYNYHEDQDTSSDSDDEVMRHYQATVQKAPSQRSLRSNKSATSKASKSSKASKAQHAPKDGEAPREGLQSLAEKGGSGSIYSSDLDHERGPPPGSVSTGSPTHPQYQGEDGEMLIDNDRSPDDVAMVSHSNQAFQDDERMSPDQGSSSHMSPYGENSMSVGDPDHDEHLFDVSDLQQGEPQLISKCGNLEVTFNYEIEKFKMHVTVHQATEIPTKDRGGANNTQVRLLLLPNKKVKQKTKIRQGDSPQYKEKFTFKVTPDELPQMGIRFRLYGCERMRRERMIGETVFGFASLNTDIETTHWLTLEPRSNLSHGDSKMDVSSLSRSDSASSTQSMQHGGMPELLVGLSYNGTTGRLSAEVIKGSNFRNMAMSRAPDTYVKLTLMSPNGQEIAHSKTSIRRGQPHPLFKETFMFQVALFQLPDVTLMVSVYTKRSMKRKEMVGWFSLGHNNSGEEELSHWNDMRESKGEQVCRWHVLLEA